MISDNLDNAVENSIKKKEPMLWTFRRFLQQEYYREVQPIAKSERLEDGRYLNSTCNRLGAK